jgi:hypothetical protein
MSITRYQRLKAAGFLQDAIAQPGVKETTLAGNAKPDFAKEVRKNPFPL